MEILLLKIKAYFRSRVISDRTREDGFKCTDIRVRFDTRKKFLTVVKL